MPDTPLTGCSRKDATENAWRVNRSIGQFLNRETLMNTARASSHELKSSPNSLAAPIVFVVDSDDSVRQSLGLLIQGEGWHPQVFACAQEFLSSPRVLAPSCLILDVTLPDLNGLDLQKLVADRIEMAVIFITTHADARTTVRALKAGAVDFLTKPIRNELLLGAMRHAIKRSHAALCREVQIQPLRERYASLSRREREVMGLVVSGRLNKEVSGELGISEITVQAHRGRVMQKMRAGSLAGLVNMAARLSLTPAPRD
jgi:FixJ family two-component response regulator